MTSQLCLVKHSDFSLPVKIEMKLTLVSFVSCEMKDSRLLSREDMAVTIPLRSFRLLSRRSQWHPTLVLLPGKSHGRRSLVGCSPWGCEELDTTERLHFHFSLSCIGEGNGNPLQCSCLESPRESRAWLAAVYGVAQSRTRLKWLSSSSRFLSGKSRRATVEVGARFGVQGSQGHARKECSEQRYSVGNV